MSTCEVDFSDTSDDADPVEFCNRRAVTARKSHTCDECRGSIAIGEKHEVIAYRFEGEYGSGAFAHSCTRLRYRVPEGVQSVNNKYRFCRYFLSTMPFSAPRFNRLMRLLKLEIKRAAEARPDPPAETPK